MRILLTTPLSRIGFITFALTTMALYLHSATVEYLADRFAAQPTIFSLEKAIRLQPRNAEYRYRLGRYYSLVQQSPQQALPLYQAATQLNPHQAAYWFSLANADHVLGFDEMQKAALERALQADPTTPDVAWEAANLYLARGMEARALEEFGVVIRNDSYRVPEALRLCWKIKPDMEFLFKQVLPRSATVYFALLEYLVSEKQDAMAAAVWVQIAQLNQPLEAHRVFDYIRYLLAAHQIEQARLVWRQAANLCGLSSYQPSAENLVINGDFGLDILNAGFDWQYHTVPGVALALDPAQPHLSPRSLSISYDGSGLDDSGILQMVPVEPDTRYEFSAYFKALHMLGAGGPQFVIEDGISGASYLSTENLRDTDFWRQTGGTFATPATTTLVTIRIRRVPAGSPIRGKLWIDGVRLAKKKSSVGG